MRPGPSARPHAPGEAAHAARAGARDVPADDGRPAPAPPRGAPARRRRRGRAPLFGREDPRQRRGEGRAEGHCWVICARPCLPPVGDFRQSFPLPPSSPPLSRLAFVPRRTPCAHPLDASAAQCAQGLPAASRARAWTGGDLGWERDGSAARRCGVWGCGVRKTPEFAKIRFENTTQ